MRIISHRARHDVISYPDNTLQAVQNIWDSGLTGVEVDVWMTVDNKIILSHDPVIQCKNGNKYIIKDTNYDVLSSIDLGNGIKPVLLSEVLFTVPKSSIIFIEIKCGSEIIPALEADLAKTGLGPEQVFLIGFIDNQRSVSTMLNLADTFSTFDIYALFGKSILQIRKLLAMKEALAGYIINEAKAVHAKGIDIPLQLASENIFTHAHDHGLSCHVWNVLKPEHAKWLYSLGVDTVTTDKPKLLSQVNI
ncbi:MAG: glycerophosphodiester phosphodiesterase family protein [Chitinispirillia bacterium]|jgi:glycerophosphoryl diester phosphodiesterase